ncbi:DUF5712 family protein [Bacteroides sp. 51]|uniref:DUF5712 family protein n=1 Tax=Bacteroides sp. 51 TaxID=2302938 RepID=UPI0013D23CD2|nr:DUF5712 family protein [Bacteroides sp. 51]NDV83453.1 mobilization protein [Bacteroides sp. 51]
MHISQNAGSCVKLVDYLSKEEGLGKTFFSHTADDISPIDVIEKIDNNKRTLKKNQDKFYMLSYSPSQREIQHLVKHVTGKKITEFSELTESEKQQVFDEFKNYVRDCMNVYAKNFNREKELTGDDLVYFGRIEEDRHYTHLDKEYEQGLKRPGDLKPGLNMHAHVIVSRMDVSQTIALSPLTNSKGNTNVLNGKEVKNGFSREGWQAQSHQCWCEKYRYIPTPDEYFYMRDKAFGSFKAKIQNKILQEIMEGMKEEQQATSTVKKITSLARSPKNLMKSYLRKTIRNILSQRENEL